MSNNTSPHILNTAANLLGFCLFIITSLHIADEVETGFIDELTSIIAVLLIFSCVFSFISIRTQSPKREKDFEKIADYCFILALGGVLFVILFIALKLS